MDITSINTIKYSTSPDEWRKGDSWLAGGTVLYSYGVDLRHGRPDRLLDITNNDWEDLIWHDDELEISATCTIAKVYALPTSPDLPEQFPGLAVFRPCCDSFVASFKIWNMSTIGGNVATALPAGPMTSLLAGLDAQAKILGFYGNIRYQPVSELVTGEGTTTLACGELIRSFHIPYESLRQPAAFRRISLTERGRSAALLIARKTGPTSVQIAVTASTKRPHIIELDVTPDMEGHWQEALHDSVHEHNWHDDIHGDPAWRNDMTAYLGAELIEELFPGTIPAAAGRVTGDITVKCSHE